MPSAECFLLEAVDSNVGVVGFCLETNVEMGFSILGELLPQGGYGAAAGAGLWLVARLAWSCWRRTRHQRQAAAEVRQQQQQQEQEQQRREEEELRQQQNQQEQQAARLAAELRAQEFQEQLRQASRREEQLRQTLAAQEEQLGGSDTGRQEPTTSTPLKTSSPPSPTFQSTQRRRHEARDPLDHVPIMGLFGQQQVTGSSINLNYDFPDNPHAVWVAPQGGSLARGYRRSHGVRLDASDVEQDVADLATSLPTPYILFRDL